MNCRRAEELFSDYVEATLPIPLSKDLEQHLASCSNCAPLLQSFRDVVATLGSMPHPEPSPQLAERILTTIRARLPGDQAVSPVAPALALPHRFNWAVWAAAAAFAVLVALRPPAPLVELGVRMDRLGHHVYGYALRVYRGSERLIDDLNVLRMTVGVAFEDRLDRLNERLKDLEEARRKTGSEPEKSSTLTAPAELASVPTNSKTADPRSLS